jgi:pantothenate kinase type III
MRAELGGTVQVIATGGNAGFVADVARCVERVDEHLRLEGLRMLYEEANTQDPHR